MPQMPPCRHSNVSLFNVGVVPIYPGFVARLRKGCPIPGMQSAFCRTSSDGSDPPRNTPAVPVLRAASIYFYKERRGRIAGCLRSYVSVSKQDTLIRLRRAKRADTRFGHPIGRIFRCGISRRIPGAERRLNRCQPRAQRP
jgi:hypothetical protein